MSVKLANDAMHTFIASREPAVLCVRGEWGVGKTFGWKKQLLQAQTENAIALRRYAYVSLFGLSSLEDLRSSIVANTLRSNEVDAQPSWHTVQQAFRSARRFGRQQSKIVGDIAGTLPWIGKVLSAASSSNISLGSRDAHLSRRYRTEILRAIDYGRARPRLFFKRAAQL